MISLTKIFQYTKNLLAVVMKLAHWLIIKSLSHSFLQQSPNFETQNFSAIIYILTTNFSFVLNDLNNYQPKFWHVLQTAVHSGTPALKAIVVFVWQG